MNATSKPWLASYPPGVAETIDENKLQTLVEIFRANCKTYAQRQAYESLGVNMTYAEVEKHATAFASFLQAKGYKKGDRVALMMPNVMAYPITLFGTLLAGCTVVNVNPLYTARELVHQLKDSGARGIVVLENFGHTVQEALKEVKLEDVFIATAGDGLGVKGIIVNFVSRRIKKLVKPFSIPGATALKSGLAQGASRPLTPVDIMLHDVAFLQYTGGTTGVSKGAVLTHRNIAANVAQVRQWFGASHSGSNEEPAVMVTALPLYHIYALTCCCFYMFADGGKCLLIANPRDIPGFIKTLQGSRFTIFSGVNTLYNALLNHPDFKTIDFSKMTMATAGGMALQSAVAVKFKEQTGKAILEGYGLSETSPVLTTNTPDIADFTGTIGLPLPSTLISIRDDAGKPVAPGTPGELCAKGPQVMSGYWNRPDETQKVMTADGFFRTGDVAIMNPDGSFKIVDRLKDMVLVSGFNVYPNEVEEVLAQHPGVLECAVVGVPDEQSGEAVAAHIVKRDPGLTEDDVRDFCRGRMTAYKVPKKIIFRAELPKTNVGKVLRRALRDEKAA
ncbi:MAG: AMP-binding protein [Beijerinckiaceae bacterium]